MPRSVKFEIPALKPERAIKFYAAIFGWKFEKWCGPEDYWLVTTGGDDAHRGNGGFMKRSGPLATPMVNSIGVDSVDDYVDRVTAHGGKVVAPKMAIPGIGYLAYCQDTEENIFGLFQEDVSVH